MTRLVCENEDCQRTHEWGANTYPVAYLFDDFGRKVQMSTYRGGSGWDTESDWANITTGTADVTVWVYEAATGLLLEKRPADYDSGDDGPKWVYTYTDEGRLYTRKWARKDASNDPIVTTYGYDSGTGDMTSVNYTDDTPDVAFTYDRAGRRETIEDVVGTRTFTYRADDMQLATESIDGSSGGLYTKLITRTFEGGGANKGRPTGFQIGTSGTPAADYDVTYLYDTATGRLNRITDGPGLPAYGVEYSWHSGSDLVEYTRYKTDASTTVASSERAYESNRDLIDYVQNKAGASPTTISRYDYLNDEHGRRTSVVYTGSAFGNYHLFKWGYNPRSELTTADRHEGTNPQQPGNQYGTDGAFAYAYDNIGNRDTYQRDGATATAYTTNEVNQYTATSNPSESFDHDADGNMLEDAQFTYTWDAENRLIEVTPKSPSNDDKKVTFAYDYMNRRVRKEVYVYASGWPQNPDEDWRFVYDEWNVILVLNGTASTATQRKYTWGLDLSGQSGTPSATGIHGAGGIGGLVAVEETAETNSPEYWFFYDANGNVGQVVNNATGYTVAAHYEYDPYGNVILADDADQSNYVNKNPIRFSTKWFDAETGLGYWGHRYYSPKLGRWITRDPIGENGGLNLYNALQNRPTVEFDALGLICVPKSKACGPGTQTVAWMGVSLLPGTCDAIMALLGAPCVGTRTITRYCSRTCGCLDFPSCTFKFWTQSYTRKASVVFAGTCGPLGPPFNPITLPTCIPPPALPVVLPPVC